MRNRNTESLDTEPTHRKRYWNQPKSIQTGSLYWYDDTYTGPDVPFLKLRGMWLLDLGFRPGTVVIVTCTDEGILLSAAPPPGPVVPKVRKMGKRQLAKLQLVA